MSDEQEPPCALHLLDRKADSRYLAEWTQLLQKERVSAEELHENSVVIFRLHKEWLALSTLIFSEVAETRPIHRIPHRSGKILLGVVNLRGQLHLCVALDKLLEIEPPDSSTNGSSSKAYRRMLEIKKNEERWIFPVDEVYGILRIDSKAMQNVPVTVAKSTANFLKGVFYWKNKSVGYLDEELLLSSLKRSAL